MRNRQQINCILYHLLLLGLIFTYSSCVEKRTDDSCYIPADDIIYHIENHLDQIDRNYGYYNTQFFEIFEITKWYSKIITPIADDIIIPVQSVLTTASVAPLPYVDKISSFARRGITLIANTSNLLTSFNAELDKFQEINQKINSLHWQYEESRDKEFLFSIRDVLDKEYRDNLKSINNKITKFDTLLGHTISILEFVKKAKFHFDSFDDKFTDLKDKFLDFWSSKSDEEEYRKGESRLSEDRVDNLLDRINSKILIVQSNSEDLSNRIEQDLSSVSTITTSIRILEMCVKH